MLEEQIQMVDLHGQYLRFKEEIDEAMQVVIDSCAFINGPQVKTFAGHLADYLPVLRILLQLLTLLQSAFFLHMSLHFQACHCLYQYRL